MHKSLLLGFLFAASALSQSPNMYETVPRLEAETVVAADADGTIFTDACVFNVDGSVYELNGLKNDK